MRSYLLLILSMAAIVVFPALSSTGCASNSHSAASPLDHEEESKWSSVEKKFVSFESDAYEFDGAGKVELFDRLVSQRAEDLICFIAAGGISWDRRLKRALGFLDTVGGLGGAGRNAVLRRVLESVIECEGLPRILEDTLLNCGKDGMSVGMQLVVIEVATPRSRAAKKFIDDIKASLEAEKGDRFFVASLCSHKFEFEFRSGVLAWLTRRAKTRRGSGSQADVLSVMSAILERLEKDESLLQDRREELKKALKGTPYARD